MKLLCASVARRAGSSSRSRRCPSPGESGAGVPSWSRDGRGPPHQSIHKTVPPASRGSELCLFVCLSVFVCLFVCLSVCLSTRTGCKDRTSPQKESLCNNVLNKPESVCLSVCLCLSLSLYVCLSLSLSVSVSLLMGGVLTVHLLMSELVLCG